MPIFYVVKNLYMFFKIKIVVVLFNDLCLVYKDLSVELEFEAKQDANQTLTRSYILLCTKYYKITKPAMYVSNHTQLTRKARPRGQCSYQAWCQGVGGGA